MINLAICLCFKNAAELLPEWLAYYRTVGVDYFYLYDNDSSDDYLPAIKPYLRRGWAELTVWPGPARQTAAYEHCLAAARGRVRWLGFLDDDEFLWPVEEADLPTALLRYLDFAGVAATWCLYGSSHYEKPPPGLVIENYVWRVTAADKHFKCVVCPTRIQKTISVGHAFQAEPGFVVVDEHKKPVTSGTTSTPSGDFLRVNHYLTKSIAEVRARRSQVQADTGKITVHPLSLWEFWAKDWNQLEDRGICRFAPGVQQILKEFRS